MDRETRRRLFRALRVLVVCLLCSAALTLVAAPATTGAARLGRAGVRAPDSAYARANAFAGVQHASSDSANNTGAPAYKLTIITKGKGRVSVFPDQSVYAPGASVRLAATADPGWAFSGWSFKTARQLSTVDLIMDSDMTVTATFTEWGTFGRLFAIVMGAGGILAIVIILWKTRAKRGRTGARQ